MSALHALWAFTVLALSLQACSRQQQPTDPVAVVSSGLQFVEDDYQRALALATERKVPLFVDVWASWCHTCLSMKQYVFPDPAIKSLSSSFVWLAIDSERRDNAAFLERFPTRNLPTLWVIDPGSQTPLLKWIGAATAPELKAVLEDTLQGRAEQLALQPMAAEAAELNTAWLRAQHASAAGETDKAIDFYKRVLELAPPGWARRPRAVEALSMRFADNKQADALVVLAAREAPNMPAGTSRLNVVLNALDAADELPADAPERKELPALIELGTQIAEKADPSVLLDDRSSLYLSLINAEKTAHPAHAKQLAKRLSQELDAQAAKETDPARRRVWDPQRVEAYLALEELGERGQAERAIPMLQQSERDAPQDYNAPARLARVYYTLKRLPEARAAIDRALPLADGPRKLRLALLKADILVASGEPEAARAALHAASDFAKHGQLPGHHDKLIQLIEARADALAGKGAER